MEKALFGHHLNSIKSGADYWPNEFNGSDRDVRLFNPSTLNVN